MPDVKPGWRSTEFWVTIITAIPGILVMLQLVPSADEPTLETLATKLAAGVVSAITVYKYIHSRTELKKEVTKS